jgi:hypothetical protein
VDFGDRRLVQAPNAQKRSVKAAHERRQGRSKR